MAQQQLSAQQRAILFGQATRQTLQTMPTQQVTSENSSVQFVLPKTRLLSKIMLEVEAVATLKAASAVNIAKDVFSPYQILRRVSLDLNNGFSPFIVPGRDLLLYNTDRLNPDVLFSNTNARGMNYVENAATVAGQDQKIKFMVELPITLNDRDPVGLILLQNPETQVTLTLDIETLAKAYKPKAGETVTFKSMQVTPVLETFTIPPSADATPDISVLKLVQSKADIFAGNGQNVVKLNVGTIYRKLVLYLEDNDGVPLKDTDFSGQLELVFNQADIPISIKPSVLSARNASQLGYALPDGVFIFDFSNQGLPNMGGSRDYVDTERLTEFWLRFSTNKSGKVTAISETLSRLR
ncbi:cytoplasmic protein [Bacillus sp. ISL-57]|uniref:cytoplasmic protein n=1 Tax=Bacillus sp. ISL-57 TaxID=2819135 RepID=UPI001BE5E3BA|nr:cytoplasmic protein [Bacillus sp. ISL-57]MBT2718072.1 cytoplasmic protein [Bacillus sp. ISL-57]